MRESWGFTWRGYRRRKSGVAPSRELRTPEDAWGTAIAPRVLVAEPVLAP